jgi:hypothetical protein
LPLGFNSEHSYKKPDDPQLSSFWLWKYSKDAEGGAACCSLRWISTHYTKPEGIRIPHSRPLLLLLLIAGRLDFQPPASSTTLALTSPSTVQTSTYLVIYALDALERSQCKNDGMQWPWLALPTKHEVADEQ